MTPCVCGTADAARCLAGAEAPNGAVYPDYVADFGPNISVLVNSFTDPTYGSGRANSIIQCAAAYDCRCF